ncbi:hypothetical protein CFP66_44725 [Pseudonocardia sp. MH-G8]|nr:hypothetical protein CFP66_44725 [Pseudonocardia sp. MH-G8]
MDLLSAAVEQQFDDGPDRHAALVPDQQGLGSGTDLSQPEPTVDLSHAGLVAARNDVTVLESSARSGGAFPLTGLTPRFNNVTAAEPRFTACRTCTAS